MNSLSFLIFAIAIFEKISFFTAAGITISMMFIIGMIILFLGSYFVQSIDSPYNEKDKAAHAVSFQAFRAGMGKFAKWPVILLVVFAVLNTFAIDRNYMVMIAASEVGEMALQTEGGKQLTGVSADAVDLLRTYINSEKDNIKKAMLEQTSVLKDKATDLAVEKAKEVINK